VSFILAGGLLRRGHIAGRKGKESATLDLAQSNVGVSHEVMELVHQVLGNEVGPADLVEGVSEHGHIDLLMKESMLSFDFKQGLSLPGI
jgi:hypothetical protein